MNESSQSPEVSIVLPTYNGARYLRQSIDSCLSQTYKDIELIIVDDCSTDETPDIVRSYNDPRVRYVRNETNQRLPRSLNIGFALTTGEYLTWTSDDNMYKENAIETMVQCLQENNGYDFVYADYWAYYVATETKVLRQLPEISRLHKQNCVGACFLYTRKVYETVGGYSPQLELVEDYDYWLRISKKFKMFHYREPLYVYYEHNSSLKSTRQRSIILFENVMKYRNGYISSMNMARAAMVFCIDVLKFRHSFTETKSIYVQTISRVHKAAPFLTAKIAGPFLYLALRKCLKNIFIQFIDIAANLYARLDVNSKYKGLQCAPGKINVLCIIPFLHMGGSEQVLLNAVSGLRNEKYEFYGVIREGKENVWLAKFQKYFKSIFIPSEKILGFFVYYGYIRYLIVRFRIKAIVLSNAPLFYEMLPKLKKKCKGIKVIDILHAEGLMAAGDGLMWAAPFVDRRICISCRLQKFMIDKYAAFGFGGQFNQRVSVIYNGVARNDAFKKTSAGPAFRQRYNIPQNAKIISFIGRLSTEKDPLAFVDIAAKLVHGKETSALRFVIAGDGPQKDQVREKLESAGLQDYVRLIGMVDNAVDVIRESYLLLVVSRREGIPLVIPEAWACGVPVISTDVGAIKEVIQDSFNGYLVDPNENMTEQIVAKIEHLMDNENQYKIFSENVRKSFDSKFLISTMHMRYKEEFDALWQDERQRDIAAAGAGMGR